ncbi:hypothetical protein CLAFUW4_01833 [Fulvia fulva]|uniref:Uncharacterized protein n=1 Tax=Passalora fulva TaxID=5499 RepID=A0A9Q8L7H0_PASFU|nr:uncharacterized protein CLAFUR5_01828 [Fulvia fulva]KAK4635760.1 hypothetical protein CLAFUR4_01828 [Fulvia fulva]KAK4636907.1 hypothetical protein CLAFUR0_01830 [Fulvia fulva]UJO12258.1 hypothetical protein CLAFUR5_01828 [Fulvia fulva]WPV08837.1 hypothetical protein CLAFUW4_01833 [Fulvia fulva]WPV24189.1 hypothetical protein CLAFUW7_01832 [Fulvia fulva]
MASHVPILAVQPDDHHRADAKTRNSAAINGLPTRDSNIQPAMAPAADDTVRVRAPAQKIPSALRLPLVALTSLSLSSILYSGVSGFAGPELAAVSRDLTSAWHIGAMVLWKLSELSIAWYACYDYLDLAYLTLLNNVPHYFLLNTFYGIDFFATIIPLLIDIVTIALPFWLFRTLNHGHDTSGPRTDNQRVAQDKGTQYLTALFGSSIYSLVVYGSFVTWLPVYIVLHFDGVRSLEKAHTTAIWTLVGLFAPLGYAATQFVFVPAIGSHGNPGITDSAVAPFDTVQSGFVATILHNFRLDSTVFTRRAEILAKRTAILAACSFLNTFVRTYFTIEGTELVGSLGWAGVWAAAAGLTGVAYAWVGNE